MSLKTKFRCECPITSAIDLLGDRWTLVIIKQMLTENMQTFKDFTESDEAIATNILSSRLKMMEEFKIITKEKLPDNKKTNIYRLTERGIALAPIIVELAIWSDANLREFHLTLPSNDQITSLKENKEQFILTIQRDYRIKTGHNIAQIPKP